MGTLTGLFSSTRNTLLSDQLAIDATAQNIQNQNSDGYVRRTVTWSELDTVQIGTNSVGRGATATVSAQRDRVLDRSVQQATDTASASSARLTVLQNLEGLFKIDSSGNDSSGISTALSGFFTAIRAAAANPGSISVQANTIAATQAVADSFQRTSSQIESQRAALNQQVTSGVQQVNGLLEQIASLNEKIGSAGARNTDGLEDERTSLITQVSQSLGLHQAVGDDNTLTLSTGHGTLLVAGNQAFPLSTATINGNTHIFASASQGAQDITSALQGGSIAGTLQGRDTDLLTVESQLDNLAYSLATTVNAQNEAGVSAAGAPGTALFAIGGSASGAASDLALETGAVLATAAVGEGSGGNGNANALLALQSANTTAGQSFSDVFSSLLAGLGRTTASAKATSAADAANQTQLSTQRDQLSGVSLDTEAANLTQYQRAYQASAKLLGILNELLATAINIGSNTTVQ